ncbi:MAG: SPOR domain-containing protein [bacterium]
MPWRSKISGGCTRTVLGLGLGCLLLTPLAVPGQETPTVVSDHFAASRYDEARELSAQLDRRDREPATTRICLFCLERDPENALAALRQAAEDEDISPATRIRLALEMASIEFARGRFQDCLLPLERLLAQASEALPGEVYLLAGMANHALSRTQRSREAFASVLQSDPMFPWARFYLGQIALEEDDIALALRYFESAERSPLAARLPALLVGSWEALTAAGRHDEAAAKREQLLTEFPQSLASLQLLERQRHLDSDSPAGPTVVETGSTASERTVPAVEPSGRFSVQLAAFSDRGRALAFVATWQTTLAQIRIIQEPGAADQVLYKVRTGSFTSRPLAFTEAQRLQRQHGLEAMVVESNR